MKQKYSNKRDLLFELVRTNFKLRYNNSFLGFLWVILKPLMTFLVLYFVFSRFKGGWVENYQIYLLLGIILFTFINEGIVFGMHSILDTSHIILKVNFPREVALTASIIMAVVNFLINLLILGLFIIFNPVQITLLSAVYFIFLSVLLVIIVYVAALFTSIWLVQLRDLDHITTVVMQLLFYAMPIFYSVDIIPENYRKILLLNPLATIIQAAREAMIYGKITSEIRIFVIFAVSLIFFVIGKLYFNRKIKRIAELF